MPVNDGVGTRLSYDAVASSYAAEVGGELAGKPLDRALLDAVRELSGDGVVLDLGCGPGHVTSHLGWAVGLDLSPGMCAVGRRTTGLAFAAGDLTALPVRSGAAAGVVCLYAVIHLDEAGRERAYGEVVRVLALGGHALVAFHVSSADVPVGGAVVMDTWWGSDVDLTFRFLDPDAEVALLAEVGLSLVARVDREPIPGVEHPSRRSYLLVRRD